jgi:hypothetical protein
MSKLIIQKNGMLLSLINPLTTKHPNHLQVQLLVDCLRILTLRKLIPIQMQQQRQQRQQHQQLIQLSHQSLQQSNNLIQALQYVIHPLSQLHLNQPTTNQLTFSLLMMRSNLPTHNLKSPTHSPMIFSVG